MLTINATLVAIIINFIILVYVLNYFLYKPVLKILEDRKQYVQRQLAEVEAKMTSANAFMEEGRQAIHKANLSAKEIINQAVVATEKTKKESMLRVKQEIEVQKNKAKEEIAQYKISAKRWMFNEAAKLSVVIAEKILAKKIDKTSQKTIVDDFIGKIRN